MTVVWALTWLGQSAALAALTAACVRLPVCRSNAAIRHVAWSLALFLSAGLLAWPLLAAATTVAPLDHEAGAAGLRAAASIPLIEVPAAVTLASSWLGWAWALGAAAALAMVARDVWRVGRLKRRAVALTAVETSKLGAALSGWTSRRAPRLAWCDELECPALLGFFGPVIALPPSQVSALSAGQLRLVLLHELAHVRRGDDWWALAERVVHALAWVNPALHWVRRELSLAREMACDEWVVQQTAAPAAYARCLADVAGLQTHARRLRLAAGMGGRQGTLRRRVVGVLAIDSRPSPRAAAVVAWLAPVAVGLVAAGLVRLPPVFVVAHPPDAAAAAPASSGSTGEAARAPVEWPAARPEAASQLAAARRQSVERRASRPAAVPAEPAGTSEARVPAPSLPDMAKEPAEAAGRQSLAARPIPGAGAPGVTAADTVPERTPPQAAAARGWSGPAAIGAAAGGAVATAGRATASFLTRAGSRMPVLFKR